jgi:quinol monooxygenase YgiN
MVHNTIVMNISQSASLVIVAYKPKPGKSEELKQLVASHVPDLAKLGLVTNRQPVIVEAADGTIIEVFEWASAEAIQQAHSNPGVHKIWAAFNECCDYVPLNTLKESGDLFAGFRPLN